mgnify:CR=1 FL=1
MSLDITSKTTDGEETLLPIQRNKEFLTEFYGFGPLFPTSDSNEFGKLDDGDFKVIFTPSPVAAGTGMLTLFLAGMTRRVARRSRRRPE